MVELNHNAQALESEYFKDGGAVQLLKNAGKYYRIRFLLMNSAY
jgi:hypothetical protein